ncbi:SGNH/GDSL hydrolase family protein [Streptomyces sp. SAJ15]|uniref:SGNH/GDSL hydrolase family protein n=1 Tax=Streptomyces sp. SAJ15 TaxID=2011095 RepID=UPI001186A8E8|nr:SGNH/GDSL hydrolase family protein [Streptomyces sp. SAJ15]TVL92921.1 G-D-S-L family lipolytic protein [Streptomyces sp. SAJ15]
MLVGRPRRRVGGVLVSGLVLVLATAAVPARATAPDTGPDAGPAAPATAPPLPLERLFDNRGVSDDAHPRGADFDDRGNSLSARDLTAAGWTPGRSLALDGARLRWPRTRAGKPDNVRANGQSVRVSGRGDALSFLVAATGRETRGDGTVHYADGTRSAYTLAAPDWRTGPLATKAVALPHINSPEGQRAEQARLYALTVPVARGRTIVSVTLPKDPGRSADLHVFALAVRSPASGWTGSWSAGTSGRQPVGPWTDRTLRLVVHTSASGPRVRVRLANTFASTPIAVGHASVAVQASGAGAADPPRKLAFGGKPGTRIPAGAQAFSDPLDFSVPADANLLVSLHLPGRVTALPVHARAYQRSYVSGEGSGDRTGDRGGARYTGTLTTWPLLTGVDVGGGPGSVVALGDSITDGDKSTVDGNRRWPDVLARRLRGQSAVPRYGVLNHGISANRVVGDRYPGDGVSTEIGGVSAQHRLERDVLAQTSVRTLVVLEGINDVRSGTSADAVIAGLRSLAERARGRGLRVVAATVLPCGGNSGCTPRAEEWRREINAFIRGADGGVFHAVLDFDAVIRDPRRPDRMLPAYDSGDHLHPGDAGLRAMADSIALRKLVG